MRAEAWSESGRSENHTNGRKTRRSRILKMHQEGTAPESHAPPQASTLNQGAEVNGCISEDGMTRGMCGHVFLMKQLNNNRLPQGPARQGKNLTRVFLYRADEVSRRWAVVFTASKVCGGTLLLR